MVTIQIIEPIEGVTAWVVAVEVMAIGVGPRTTLEAALV
jgi:hypothetical protein